MTLHPATLLLFAISPIPISMGFAGVALFLIALLAAKTDLADAHGLDKIVALTTLCFSVPLAVFAVEHFAGAVPPELVPGYMPWRTFWIYFVGFALIATALSVATRIQLRWSCLLFAIMMVFFDAMIHIPGALADPSNRILRVIVLREMSFGCGALLLSASVPDGWSPPVKRLLITAARLLIAIGAIFFGVQHFLHPGLAPGVPLAKPMADWIPMRPAISYVTGVILVVCGLCILLARMTRMAATYLGAWLLLLVVFIYGPMLIAALFNPSTGAKIEGLNYFFDTLLYAGVILAVARATPRQA